MRPIKQLLRYTSSAGERQMPRPKLLILIAFLSTACDGTYGGGTAISLDGTLWQVEDIDEGGIIDRSHVTLEFPGGGQLGGSTGCNRYFGTLVIDGESFSVDGTGSTRRACVPAIMQQEQRFLTALSDARTYGVKDELWLELYDAEGKRRIRAIRIEEEAAMDDAPGDEPDDES